MTLTELYDELVQADKDYTEARYYLKYCSKKKERDIHERKALMIETRVKNLFDLCPEAASLSNDVNFLSSHYFETDLALLMDRIKQKIK